MALARTPEGFHAFAARGDDVNLTLSISFPFTLDEHAHDSMDRKLLLCGF